MDDAARSKDVTFAEADATLNDEIARAYKEKHGYPSGKQRRYTDVQMGPSRQAPSKQSMRARRNMSDRPVFVYASTYASTDDAWLDYEILLELHADKLVGTYDAAVVDKDADGKVHVHKHEKATQHGAWGGIAVGALVGVLFPPSLIGAAAVGGAVGGLGGHFRKGISRGDVKELGETLESGEAALIVIGESRIEEQLDKALTHAEKSIEKEIDADSKEFTQELQEAEKEAAANLSA